MGAPEDLTAVRFFLVLAAVDAKLLKRDDAWALVKRQGVSKATAQLLVREPAVKADIQNAVDAAIDWLREEAQRRHLLEALGRLRVKSDLVPSTPIRQVDGWWPVCEVIAQKNKATLVTAELLYKAILQAVSMVASPATESAREELRRLSERGINAAHAGAEGPRAAKDITYPPSPVTIGMPRNGDSGADEPGAGDAARVPADEAFGGVDGKPTDTSEDDTATTASAPLQLDGVATAFPDTTETADALNRENTALAIAELISDPEQDGPLTIAIMGDWGAGKTWLLGRIREFATQLAGDRTFRFAEFSAWHYEHCDSMAAALTQVVVEALSAFKPCAWIRRLVLSLRFHYRLNRRVVLGGAALFVLASAMFFLGMASVVMLHDSEGKWLAKALGVGSVGTGFGLFVPFVRWVWKGIAHPFGQNTKSYLDLPRYGKHLGVAEILRQHVKTLIDLRLREQEDRLVVIVEDLDRCRPESIATTLDAIRLVMDEQRVVAIIAMDPRIALSAMAKQYKDVAGGLRAPSQVARDYLGKIVQVPLRIGRPTEHDIEDFIANKLFDGAIGADASDDDEDGSASDQAAADDGRVDARKRTRGGSRHQQTRTGGVSELVGARTVNYRGSLDAAEREGGRTALSEASVMRHSTDEQRWFQSLTAEFSFDNPRMLTRLRNSYRLLRRLRRHYPERLRQELPDDMGIMRLLFWREFVAQQRNDHRKALLGAVAAEDENRVFNTESTDRVVAAMRSWRRGLGPVSYEAGSCFVAQVVLPAYE